MAQLARKLVYVPAAAAVLVAASWSLAATPPADTLLPASARGFISIPNTPAAVDLWKQTLMGRLLDDPSMQPFVEDMRQQLERKWREENSRIGFKWDDLRPAVSGEMAFAVIHEEGKQGGLVLLADVTGREDQARRLLASAEKAMQDKRARKSTQTVAGVSVAIYDEPRRADDPPNKVRRTCYFLADNLLGASSQLEIVTEVLTRRSGQAGDNLAGVAAYRAVNARWEKDLGPSAPAMRWWADPLGCLAAAQANVDPTKRRDTDMLKTARKVGFDGFQAVGGMVQLGGRQDLLARTFIYAPKPWKLAMNMFVFPNGAGFEPHSWVPADVANYITLNLDIQTAEANFEPLFDQLFGDGETGVWTDVKESLRDDPNGPGLDIEKDLIAHLGTRITFVSDFTSPTTLDCERTCLAIEVKNEKALAESIRKSMETDPNVRRREFQGHVIWEMLEETIDGPAVEREAVPGAAGRVKAQLEEEIAAGQGDRLLPRSSVTVAQGHLFVASNVEFLEKLLSKRTKEQSLAAARDYQFIDGEINRLHSGQQSCRFFMRVDEVVRPHFDLVRQNQMPQAKTSVANFMNRILNGSKDRTEIRKPEIDGSKLPDFELVRKHFGLGGGVMITETDGWYLVNLVADKPEAQQAGANIGRASAGTR